MTWLLLACVLAIDASAAGKAPLATPTEPEYEVKGPTRTSPVATDIHVVLDGATISKRGAVIKGEAYVPIRDLERSVGVRSTLDASAGTLLLTRKAQATSVPTAVPRIGRWVSAGSISVLVSGAEEPEQIGTSYPADGHKFLIVVGQVRHAKKDATDVEMVQGRYVVHDSAGSAFPLKCQPPYLGRLQPGLAESVRFTGEIPITSDPIDVTLKLPGDDNPTTIKITLKEDAP